LVTQCFWGSYAAEEKEKQKGVKVGAGEMDIEATVIKGSPIKADQPMSKDHPSFARGMVCVECHEVTFDAVTTATKQFVINYRQLNNDEIWKKIEAFLPGRERFALTTVYNNEPNATTIDMVLDKNKKVLYAVCEKGTEKLMHIRKNPRICAVHYEGWTLAGGGKKEWKSVQIRGNAEVIPSTDPRFNEIIDTYRLARVSKVRALLRFDVVKIVPTTIIYFDTNLPDEKTGIYQLWQRSDITN
jgi:nitroimidazol reductase NimA-like FMN-containing flavoprotein (pyridoxamine 5'-phosphate oxidase superfamily)